MKHKWSLCEQKFYSFYLTEKIINNHHTDEGFKVRNKYYK